MSVASLDRSLAAAQAWLAERESPETAVASHEAGLAEGQADAKRWIHGLLVEQGVDGSWDGDLLRTAESLLTIQELRRSAGLLEQDPSLGLALDWLRRRQGAPGAWTDGCSEDRHRLGLCHHFMGGFFSPGPPEVPFEEARLRSGSPVRGDREVRFAASAVALRAGLAWERRSGDTALHLEGLRRIVRLWSEHQPVGLSTTAILAAVHALIEAGTPQDDAAATQGLLAVAGKQRGDGSWVDADAFQALEVFGAAVDRGVAQDRTRRALWHGARLLISTQQSDGSWGPETGPRRALIGWRTFRRVDPPATE